MIIIRRSRRSAQLASAKGLIVVGNFSSQKSPSPVITRLTVSSNRDYSATMRRRQLLGISTGLQCPEKAPKRHLQIHHPGKVSFIAGVMLSLVNWKTHYVLEKPCASDVDILS